MSVTVHVRSRYGQPLHEVAKRRAGARSPTRSRVRSASAVAAVDVFVDGIVFEQ